MKFDVAIWESLMTIVIFSDSLDNHSQILVGNYERLLIDPIWPDKWLCRKKKLTLRATSI
jgi:hypothetical protein